MPPGLTFVVLSPEREFYAALESSVHVEIRAHVEEFEDLVRTVELERPDALLIALGENPEAAFATLEKLPTPRPLLFFCGPDDSQSILQAMRMGARKYIAPEALHGQHHPWGDDGLQSTDDQPQSPFRPRGHCPAHAPLLPAALCRG